MGAALEHNGRDLPHRAFPQLWNEHGLIMDPASIVILAVIAVIVISLLLTFAEELIEVAAVVGVIWIICLIIDYQSTMAWTTNFIQAAHAFVSNTLATLGVH